MAVGKSDSKWFLLYRSSTFSVIFFVLSWALDFVSSVIMIVKLGSTYESNFAQVHLVQHPSLIHLYWWFMNELFYFVLLAIILISFFTLRFLMKVHKRKLLRLGPAILVLFISLVFGVYRFIVGYLGNMNTMAAKLGLIWIVIFYVSFGAIVGFAYWYVLLAKGSQH